MPSTNPPLPPRTARILGRIVELALDALEGMRLTESECDRYQRQLLTIGQMTPRPRILVDRSAKSGVDGLDWTLLLLVRRCTQTLSGRIAFDGLFLAHVLHSVLPGDRWAPLTLTFAESLGVELPPKPGLEVQGSPMNLRPRSSPPKDHPAT